MKGVGATGWEEDERDENNGLSFNLLVDLGKDPAETISDV